MSTKTDFILKALKVVSWIIFLGLCIQTGAFLFNYIFSLFNPAATHNLYEGLDLSELFGRSRTHYSSIFSFVLVVSGLKAYVFYLIIRLLMQLNLVKPFSIEVYERISKISYFILAVGIVGFLAQGYMKGLIHRGFSVGAVGSYWSDSAAFLMMAAIVFLIAQIFKKGIDLQMENDLTV